MNSNKNIILSTRSLIKKYGEHTVLNGIDLKIYQGEVLVILGPSGCGKSTFLRCLNGLEQVDQGDIFFQNLNLTDPKTNWPNIRQQIGMVFQSYDLFPHLSVLENITIAPIKIQKRDKEEAKKSALKWLERVGLLDKKDVYPRSLSGGQKQRIAIIRALNMNPNIMLFDEVTASLDPEMVREVQEVMTDFTKEGMTMLIVTHEMNFAQKVADRIIFFDQGKIIEDTHSKDFFKHPTTERARKFLSIFESF